MKDKNQIRKILFHGYCVSCRYSIDPGDILPYVINLVYQEKSKKWYSCFLLILSLFFSCDSSQHSYTLVPAPEEVRQQALIYAKKYIELGATYEWGGQDPLPRRLVVDCSGLIIRCYQYACEDYRYRLPFSDETASGMQEYAEPLKNPEPGDVIFMGNEAVVTHIALFVRKDETHVFFIDSTELPEENVYGVSERCYKISDPRFIWFGRMMVYQ